MAWGIPQRPIGRRGARHRAEVPARSSPAGDGPSTEGPAECRRALAHRPHSRGVWAATGGVESRAALRSRSDCHGEEAWVNPSPIDANAHRAPTVCRRSEVYVLRGIDHAQHIALSGRSRANAHPRQGDCGLPCPAVGNSDFGRISRWHRCWTRVRRCCSRCLRAHRKRLRGDTRRGCDVGGRRLGFEVQRGRLRHDCVGPIVLGWRPQRRAVGGRACSARPT